MAEQTDKPNRCPLCGATGMPLERVHIVPISKGGSRGAENMILLCPNCHSQMDRGEIREFEFVVALSHLMRLSGQFDTLTEQLKVGNGARVDIFAHEKSGGRKLLIECKSSTALNHRRSFEIVEQLRLYRSLMPDAKAVLALPTRLDSKTRSSFVEQEIEVWDLDEIARLFPNYLDQVQHPMLRAMLLGVSTLDGPRTIPTAEAILIDELTGMLPGRETWSTYQKLIARILERLFVPPLSPPLYDISDEERRNRRDIVLPNYSESGFWTFMRLRYAADFIVVDAKNSEEEVGKEEALQVLHYLKEDGAGLFGVIVSRKGLSEAGRHALTNHWIRHGKLVICLSDEQIIQMLRLKEAGASAETVIRQAIEDFRLSL